jgi:hypothetical protein
LITQPDQAQGFPQDVERRILIAILRKKMLGTRWVLAEKDAIRQLHVFPFPATAMTRFRGGKEAPPLDHLPSMLLDLARQEVQQFA